MHPELEKYNYNRNIKPLNKAITETLKKLGIYEHILEAKVKKIWAEIAGVSALRYTAEIRIIKNKVYVKITSSALRQDLLMNQTSLTEKINQRLGSNLEGMVIY